MSLLDLLLEPFGFEFMVRAMAATTIAAVVCAVLSCWLVLIGWSLMGDAVAHAVLPGVVLAYLVGAPFALGALAFGLLAGSCLISGGSARTGQFQVKEDAAGFRHRWVFTEPVLLLGPLCCVSVGVPASQSSTLGPQAFVNRRAPGSPTATLVEDQRALGRFA